jgi:hypothetical protein
MHVPLSQISREDTYIRISSSVPSFVQTYLPTMFAVLLSIHALNYTGFSGLVQVPAESKCGASLHRQRKCSQAGCLLVNGDLGESALEGGYMWESASPEKQGGTCTIFTLMCNPTLIQCCNRHHPRHQCTKHHPNKLLQKSPPLYIDVLGTTLIQCCNNHHPYTCVTGTTLDISVPSITLINCCKNHHPYTSVYQALPLYNAVTSTTLIHRCTKHHPYKLL